MGEDLIILPYKFGDIMTKKCSKCKKVKNVSEFFRRNVYPPSVVAGYRYICKPCDNKLSSKKRKAGGWKNEKKRQGPDSNHAKLSKINSQKHRNEISDMYVKSLITKKYKDLDSKDIPDELIQLYRVSLQIKRKLGLTPKLKDSEQVRSSNLDERYNG